MYDAHRDAYICDENDMVYEPMSEQTRCCHCGRTESWGSVDYWGLMVCSCGHELCGSCSPIHSAEPEDA